MCWCKKSDKYEVCSLLTSSSTSFPTIGPRSWTSEARSAASCPPQTGFNAFAFLAFILIAIDTIMNINNNINNNNNNNNNNDRNNNNNNNFEAMNMNMRRSFKEENLYAEVTQCIFSNWIIIHFRDYWKLLEQIETRPSTNFEKIFRLQLLNHS